MEKSETGGSDPCHPIATHLAAEICTGTSSYLAVVRQNSVRMFEALLQAQH